MNIDKEVNMKLFQQQQEQSRHLDYEKEFGIYKAIANGNMEEVKARHKEYEEHKGYTTGNDKNGVLSADPLQNAKYHFVILAAMTSRFCAQYGLPREIAYSMSDIFIQRMDVCKKKEVYIDSKRQTHNTLPIKWHYDDSFTFFIITASFNFYRNLISRMWQSYFHTYRYFI